MLFRSVERGDALIDFKREITKELKSRKLNKRKDIISSLNPALLPDITEYREAIFNHNKQLVSLICLNNPAHQRRKLFEPLMLQDWSSVYPCASKEGSYYVYAHVDPEAKIFTVRKSMGGNFGGLPFYIGKGTGDRAYNLKRNQGHGKMIRQILGNGWQPEDMVKILFDDLSEERAFEIESKLIYFFGTMYEEERAHGTLLNLDTPTKPEFKGTMQTLLNRKEWKKIRDWG